MRHVPQTPPNVSSVFDQFAPTHRDVLLDARFMIFDVALTDPRIGELEETLRWGEPAYITAKNKTGSTIRLGIEKTSGQPAIFFNCRTTLVEELRDQFGATLSYSKNRAVLLDRQSVKAKTALRIGIASALTYHLRK